MYGGVREMFGEYTPSSSSSCGARLDDEPFQNNNNNLFEKQLTELKEMLRPMFSADATQSHTERSLRRFLKGNGSVNAAYDSILRYNHWRKTQGVDDLCPTDPDILSHIARGFVHTLRIRDCHGRPILYVIARKHTATGRDLDQMTRFTIYMLEQTLKKMDETVNDTLCLVFDLYRFSMSNMDYPFVKRLVSILTRFYPERLGICIIYNAPVIFQGCWPIIRHWLHEDTAKKVVFIGSKESMSDFMNVDALPPQDM